MIELPTPPPAPPKKTYPIYNPDDLWGKWEDRFKLDGEPTKVTLHKPAPGLCEYRQTLREMRQLAEALWPGQEVTFEQLLVRAHALRAAAHG